MTCFPDKRVDTCVAALSQNGADPRAKNAAGMTPLDCVKDPVLRKKLQGSLGVAVHKYEGRKTKYERELGEEPNTSDEEEDEEEWDDDDSEWDEWDWEWDEVWHDTDGSTTEEEEEEAPPAEEETRAPYYAHSNKPRTVSHVRVEAASPGRALPRPPHHQH